MPTAANYELVATTSIAGDVQSPPILAARLDAFTIQAVTTGTAAGTLFLQCSNDAGVIPEGGEQSATGIANYDTVSSVPVAGEGVYTLSSIGQQFRWARLIYVHASGTGNMTARVSAKVTR